MIDVVEWISDRVSAVTRAIVCVDGPAGAGKTTVAAKLLARFAHAQVIHMDDLYDGWDAALEQPLTHRLVTHVRDPFLAGEPVRYPRYDWSAAAFGEMVEVEPTPLLVVEGVGAAQLVMRKHAITVFLDVDPQVGRLRVIERDGEVSAAHIDDWQCRERAHFEADGTREGVDLYLP